jgi:hypothetical protein
MRHKLYPQYEAAVSALDPVLDKRDGKVVAISGRPLAGKTTFGRYLAWRFNVSLIETDLFLIPYQGSLTYREDEIARVVERCVGTSYPRPVIVEGATVLRLLAKLGIEPDFTIYVVGAIEHEVPDLTDELDTYDRAFRPRDSADFVLELSSAD